MVQSSSCWLIFYLFIYVPSSCRKVDIFIRSVFTYLSLSPRNCTVSNERLILKEEAHDNEIYKTFCKPAQNLHAHYGNHLLGIKKIEVFDVLPLAAHPKHTRDMASIKARQTKRDKILIGLVQEHPDLWDMTSPTYNRDDQRLWQKVANSLNDMCRDFPEIGASVDGQAMGTFYSYVKAKKHYLKRINTDHISRLTRLINERHSSLPLPPLDKIKTMGRQFSSEFWNEMRFVREMWERFASNPKARLPASATVAEERLLCLLREARGVVPVTDVVLPSQRKKHTTRTSSKTEKATLQDILHERERLLICFVKEYPELWDIKKSSKDNMATWKQISKALNCIFKRPDLNTSSAGSSHLSFHTAWSQFRQLTIRVVGQMTIENNGQPATNGDRLYAHWDDMKFIRDAWTASQSVHLHPMDPCNNQIVNSPTEASELSQLPGTSNDVQEVESTLPLFMLDSKSALFVEERPQDIEFESGCDTLDLNTVFGSNNPTIDMSESTPDQSNETTTIKEEPVSGFDTFTDHGPISEAVTIPSLSPQPSDIVASMNDPNAADNISRLIESLKEIMGELHRMKPNIAKEREAELLEFLRKCE